MTHYVVNVRIRGFHPDGTTRQAETLSSRDNGVSEADDETAAVEAMSAFAITHVAKWSGSSYPPTEYQAELYVKAEFADGREISKIEKSKKLRSAERCLDYVAKTGEEIVKKFAALERTD